MAGDKGLVDPAARECHTVWDFADQLGDVRFLLGSFHSLHEIVGFFLFERCPKHWGHTRMSAESTFDQLILSEHLPGQPCRLCGRHTAL